jgi:hypothetical protein
VLYVLLYLLNCNGSMCYMCYIILWLRARYCWVLLGQYLGPAQLKKNNPIQLPSPHRDSQLQCSRVPTSHAAAGAVYKVIKDRRSNAAGGGRAYNTAGGTPAPVDLEDPEQRWRWLQQELRSPVQAASSAGLRRRRARCRTGGTCRWRSWRARWGSRTTGGCACRCPRPGASVPLPASSAPARLRTSAPLRIPPPPAPASSGSSPPRRLARWRYSASPRLQRLQPDARLPSCRIPTRRPAALLPHPGAPAAVRIFLARCLGNTLIFSCPPPLL